ncbi:hypothetical protein DVH05_006595 [Phytophthora capsici]|nr:hypothetical protein DVH05_006595 [Phytophthora capsici]
MGQSTPIPASTEGSGTDLDLYQLLIQPIVKETLGQRDTSGNTLDSTVVSGGSFGEIVGKLWDRYASRVKSRGVKTDGVWSAEQPVAAEWFNVMQFKLRKHVVDSTKSEHAWNQWLVKMRGQTVLFLIFEFGTGISRAQDLVAFKAACIQPEHTDRAGATADVSLRDVISRLQANWGTTFQGPAAVWRMWGNHITRNLNRSTWERDIEELPPRYIAALLRLTDSPLEQRVVNISQSTNIALDCVRAALGDVRQVRRDNEAVARRLEELERNLEGREDILLSIQANISPPSPSSVPDPMDRLRNTEDIDHTD